MSSFTANPLRATQAAPMTRLAAVDAIDTTVRAADGRRGGKLKTRKAAAKRFNVTGWSLIDVGAKFNQPSTYGDVVEIESRVSEWGRSSFKIEHRLMRGDKVAIEAFEKRVWVGKDPENPDRLRSVPIPDEVVAKFQD